MEASIGPTPPPKPNPINDPLTQTIKLRLLKKGLSSASPKTIHLLRKKELQKRARKAKKLALQSNSDVPTTPQKRTDPYLQRVSKEYRDFTRAVDLTSDGLGLKGRPWEGKRGILGSGVGGKLKYESLRELGLLFEERKDECLSLFLDDDVDEGVDGGVDNDDGEFKGVFGRSDVSEDEVVGLLIERLSVREITAKDWKFRKIMKESGLQFLEGQMLRIIGRLGDRGSWKQAMEVVEWVYTQKEHAHYKSRFVYTKLLAVLGKSRRPHEALKTFRKMLGDRHIYPDMAAYHSIAVTLGQAGMVRELMNIIESMKEKPSKTIMNLKKWDPSLRPDIVVFNSVLNACVPSRQWKAVSWVFEELRKEGLKANSATYGLAMEVMLRSEKYDLVHELFQKMKRNGHSLKALTYKVLVKCYWKEGKVDEAIHIVRDMEQKGIIGSPSVYYELACCLCNNGRWQEAITEIEKLKDLRHSKPVAVAFTGMILSAMGGGHVDDCMSIFEHMKKHCAPNIGTINAMLKVYGRNDMFLEAKELFEEVKRSVGEHRTCLSGDDGDGLLIPDVYTYSSMLEASGRAHQWEYFEYVYKEMCVCGYNIDQDKHAALLVEASRAGKFHLLEHAFDSTLEAGRIPHPVLFSEMVLQTTSHGNYEKAASIVTFMIRAPFQINMKDWIDLIEKNKDKIGDEQLKILSDSLKQHEISEQSSASQLLQALHIICDHESLAIVSSTHDDSTCGETALRDVNFDFDRVPQCWSKDGKGSVCDPDDLNSDYNTNEDDASIPLSNSPSFGNYESSAAFQDRAFGEGPTEDEDEEINDNQVESPTADGILQLWKQMRKQDTTKASV